MVAVLCEHGWLRQDGAAGHRQVSKSKMLQKRQEVACTVLRKHESMDNVRHFRNVHSSVGSMI